MTGHQSRAICLGIVSGAVLAGAVPDLSPGSRKDALSFLEGFYATTARPDRVKRAFIDPFAKITM